MAKCTKHEWVEKRKGLKCAHCTATFPCRGACSHVDCEELKGPPKCMRCKKPVDFQSRYHKLEGVLHEECINVQEVHTTG